MTKYIALFVVLSMALSVDIAAAEYDSLGINKVPRIQNYKIDSWQAVDDRALIIKGGISEHYLVVFKNRCRELKFATNIAAPTKGSAIQAGFDSIRVVGNNSNPMPCMIKEIYKIEGDKNKVTNVRNKVRELHKAKYKR